MASTGKKGKKNKGTVISLQSFLANGNDTPAGTTQVSKKVRSYDGDDSDDGGSLPVVFQLPTAPRANRIFEDDSIPHKPPFIAYVTNLPFDANEEDLYEFFGELSIISLRLPREDGETGRVRGFGYVEFETRDDLLHVLSLPDPSIKGRRVRIDLSNESEQQNSRQRSNRRGYDNFSNSGENRDSTNWRRDNQNQDINERAYNRERQSENFHDSSTPGSWRIGRINISDSSPQRRSYIGDRYRDSNVGSRNYENNRETGKGRGTNIVGMQEETQERPKLNLKPRTLPLPNIEMKVEDEQDDGKKSKHEDTEGSAIKKTGISPIKVFGAAKPVDTAARELEIEERLAQSRHDEKLKLEQEQNERENHINEKFSEVQLEKPDKENANSAISWRSRDESLSTERDKYNSNSRGFSRPSNEEWRRDNKNINRGGDSTIHEKNEHHKEKLHLDRGAVHKDDHKSRIERSIPKLKQNQIEPILQTSNKYSGLYVETSDD